MMNPEPNSGQRKEIKIIFHWSILNKKRNLENDRGKRYGVMIPCIQ